MKQSRKIGRGSYTESHSSKKGQESSLQRAKQGLGKTAFPAESQKPSLKYGGKARVIGCG